MSSAIGRTEHPVGVQDAVEALERACAIPAKRRAVKVSGIVDTICRHAFEDGLNTDDLRAVVRVISRKTELDQSSVTSLIKNLYPAQRVAEDIVVTVVGALGQGKGKPSLGTQNGLVKWLVTVHSIIDRANVLSRLYGVLFGMLDMISIRTPLCHLLSLITRRRHVKPFRIQRLLELSRGLSNEPALQGLLRVYKDYYPDIILSNTSTSRNSFPPRPDSEWQNRLRSIIEASAIPDEAISEQHHGFRLLRRKYRTGREAVIPEAHTFKANEASVTLEEVDSVDDFIGRLERIEPPGQMVSFLADPLLQKYVDLRPTPISNNRIDLWLATSLEEEYNSAQSAMDSTPEFAELLQNIHRHTRYTKTIRPVVLRFLAAYLPVWDAVTGFDDLLGILSYIPIQSFQKAYGTYFTPLEKSCANGNPSSYSKLITFYENLIQHWTDQVLSFQNPSKDDMSAHRRSLEDLATHVSSICLSLAVSLPTDSGSPLLMAVLGFYETLSGVPQDTIVPILLPPPHLSYLLAQSASTTTFSRICGIYASYKGAFDRHPKPISNYIHHDTTTSFNSILRDLYNSLWGSKALQVTDNSPAFFCTPALRDSLNSCLSGIEPEYSVGIAFGLSNNAWLASLSAAAWWSLEEGEMERRGYDRDAMRWHKGPVSQKSLESLSKNGGVSVPLLDYKRFVLEWLAARGCGGFAELMYATHAKLRR
ncbi:Mis6-domain-containing protein [Westerdykella ornata]|uniref:Mis6-domain-containing protein n=1 Tax=Westerdykella ornata TaxID=318751 RepID=A0A6A6JUW4_WESOR|nr:Mis6-domain-containing protein [Westerdykella ornata]KAF2280411.1 Mis6-domain-containing protein [Westerdykella ornata]